MARKQRIAAVPVPCAAAGVTVTVCSAATAQASGGACVKCGMKASLAGSRGVSLPAAIAGVLAVFFLFGSAVALAAPLSEAAVRSGIGTAINVGPASRTVHTISNVPAGQAPVGDRVGSRINP